jgi:ElaB/YqjD/DUF883 family membrane-anchored ribosome-binding protein
MEASRRRIAEGLQASARAAYKVQDSLSGRMACFAGTVAGRLSRSAAYVRTHNSQEILEGARTAVRRNPGPSLAVAAALGLVLGWRFRK